MDKYEIIKYLGRGSYGAAILVKPRENEELRLVAKEVLIFLVKIV